MVCSIAGLRRRVKRTRLAGLLAAVPPIYDLLLLEVASFILSAVLLWRIRRSFNADGPRRATSILADIREGLSYV